ncbi:1108_t:CDS:2 [Dentiscutata erythropus]|uniref:1108_t:CDS:1 n=1 Tax=Dentiscutata erythropus TaxID=1348616 RepID=A0A9N8V4I7_9GLOM|nr:1108_t:CDS:2 [Dentiscutata erythropus]
MNKKKPNQKTPKEQKSTISLIINKFISVNIRKRVSKVLK